MKKIYILFICVIFMGYLAVIFLAGGDEISDVGISANTTQRTVIIDAGHGGVDGGATSAGGIVEKDINLKIAMKLKAFCEFSGFNVIMTRDSDISIHDESANTIKEQKTSDLHNRLKIANNHTDAILISIHQNKYSGSSSNGMQVFYSGNDENSKVLAESIQAFTRDNIQQTNKRKIKQITKSVYLIYNAKQPAVLVECGFLSNSAEAERLNDDQYQSELAYCIFCGMLNYYKEQE